MTTSLHVRSMFLSVFAILSFIATLGSSAPLASAQASQVTNDIALTMSENHRTLLPGGRVTFTVRMTNKGPDDATFVDVGFKVPAQLKTLSVACDQGVTSDGAFCEYASLPAGAAVVSRLVATLNSGARGRSRLLKISAFSSFEDTGILDPDLSNNAATVRLRVLWKAPAH